MNRAIRRTLSKSDFKLADDCWSKLYYKKLGYPSQNAENDYLAFLAEGGYLIGAVAKLFYPDGIDVDAQVRKPNCTYQRMLDNALRLTDELMQQDVVCQFGGVTFGFRPIAYFHFHRCSPQSSPLEILLAGTVGARPFQRHQMR